MGCRDEAGAPGHARSPIRHPAALSAPLPRAVTGPARTGFDDAVGSVVDAPVVGDGERAVPVGGVAVACRR